MDDQKQREDHTALERRVTKTESQLGEIAHAMGEQGKHIASILTAQDTQTQQIGSLLHKAGRPFPIVTILTGIGVAIMIGTLALAPLYRGLDRANANDEKEIVHRIESARLMAENKTNIEWLMKIEDRLNARIHNSVNTND